MKQKLSLLCLFCMLLSVLCGCGLSGETPAGTSEPATGSESGPLPKDSETDDPGTEPSETGTVELRTSKARMEIGILENGSLEIRRMATDGHEYLSAPQTVSFPDSVTGLSFKGVFPYQTERGSRGYRFSYAGNDLEYDFFAVSHESWSGPFEFWATLRNLGEDRFSIRNGSYFDLTVGMSDRPVATTFRKEGGCAEGWRIYNGYYAPGTGIYRTDLGVSETELPQSSAKFTPSSYTALFIWTGLHNPEKQTITLYAKGSKGDTIRFGYEDAHASIGGQWQPAVRYDCQDSYTFRNTGVWEPVTIEFIPAFPAGTDADGKVWNQDHANNGYPFYVYGTDPDADPFWVDEITINGQTQSFNGSSADQGCPIGGSWVPNGGVSIDRTTGWSASYGSSVYGKAVASYTTDQDWNAGGDISMMYIDTDDGHGLYFAQEWTNGKLTAAGREHNVVALNAMIGTGSFSTKIGKDQVFLYPPVYVGVYDGDIETGSNLYKRWFLNVKAPRNMAEDPNEPLTQQDMQIGYDVSRYGIQSIKWDYGWWTPNNSNEGLLEVNNPAYLAVLNGDTLSEFTHKANLTGVKLALYVLLKDTRLNREGVPTSVGPDAHPEWFSNRKVNWGYSADLGNPECVEFYQNYLADFFERNGVTTWRSDFEPICRSSDKANRHAANGTDVQYWCTVGFGELTDYLIENLDGFRYESCSSGGSMKDLFTMTKASVINCDDSADYMALHMSFYDSSYCIHPAQLQLPVNSLTYTPGSGNYTGSADYLYGLRCQLTGAVLLSNWSGTNSMVNETDEWETTVKVDYNEKLKPLIRNGDLYHILPRPDGKNWDGLEYVDPEANGILGAVMLWKPEGAERTKTVRLRGLEPDTEYRLSFTDRREQDCVLSGRELMETGLTVTITERVGSEIVFLSRK